MNNMDQVIDPGLIDAIRILENAMTELMNVDHIQITTAEGHLIGEIKTDFAVVALLCHALDYLENQLPEGEFIYD